MQKVNLCEQCADDKGVTDPTGFALADLLEDTGTESVIQSVVDADGDEKCDFCGFTQTDFKKTGRFGCSQCYQVFRSGLDNLLEAMHRNTIHQGKVPEHFIDSTPANEPPLNISELHALLDEAVNVEDYEEAARLRDSIAQLENPSEASEEEGHDKSE